MTGENKITVTEDGRVPMVHFTGHSLVGAIRLGDEYGSEATFCISGGVNTPQDNPDLIARKEKVAKTLRNAGIKIKDTNTYFVALENVQDLPRALEALEFDKASANEVIVLSQREIIAHQKAEIANLKRSLEGYRGDMDLATKVLGKQTDSLKRGGKNKGRS